MRRKLLQVTMVLLLASLPLSGCFLFSPVEKVEIPVPLAGVNARIEVWGNTSSEGRFEIVVTTPSGNERHSLWEDWGPAQRVSLYLTADRRLVALGGGGIAEMIVIPLRTKPKWIPYANRPRENGDDWTYLGAIDRYRKHLLFYMPSQQKECVPLYGAGFSPYRKSHQDEHSC
jgi:hypothetical protein